MRKIELLCPASSLEVLKIAVIYGADAVYTGYYSFVDTVIPSPIGITAVTSSSECVSS